MKYLRLQGVVPALVTPVNRDETADIKCLNRLLEFQVRAGVGGIFVLGSCGEFATLRDREHERIIRATVKKVGRRVPVIVGAADTGTKRVIERVRMIKHLGADGAVVLPPYYYQQPDLKVVPDFFADVAKAARFPIICYHNPHTTKIKMPFAIIKKISRINGVAGLKDSSGDLPLILREGRELQRPDFFVFTGCDRYFGKVMLAGAAGVVSGLASAVPELVVAQFKAASRGDAVRVKQAQERIDRMLRLLGKTWARSLKYMAAVRGLCKEHVCEPQAPISERAKAKIRKTFNEMGYV